MCGAVGEVATVCLAMTGKVGPGGDEKTSRLIVSCIICRELSNFAITFAFAVLGSLVS